MPTTPISVAARRSGSWLLALYADLPATLERISERGDWSAKAVLILAPLWLTPQRYANLSKMNQPKKPWGFLWIAGGLWVAMVTFSFPEALTTITPNVNEIGSAIGYWDPAWAGGVTAWLFGAVTVGMFGAGAVFSWAVAWIARWISGVLNFHPIQAPPLGYHVLAAAGHLASTSFIMLLVYLVLIVNAGLVAWLAKPELLQTVLVVSAGGAVFWVGFAALQIRTIRAQQVYGGELRALAYQMPTCAALLVAAFFLLRA